MPPGHAAALSLFAAGLGSISLPGLSQSPRLAEQRGARRQEAEQFISRSFARMHGARISAFMPTLLGLRDSRDEVYCACGLRSAEGQNLFIEHYLDTPIETALQTAGGTGEIPRGQIVEVGNLAVSAPGSARELITELTDYLSHSPHEWVVCAALAALRNAFLRLGIPLLTLAPATLEALPEAGRAAWGSYYQHNPQVIAINVQASLQALKAAGLRP